MRKKISASKRQTCAMKYKIRKRASEHRRRVRKESKKAVKNNIVRRNVSNALHIPNIFPQKKQMLIESDILKEVKLIEKNKKRNKKHKEEVPDLIED